jgi:glycine oxidase
MEPVRGQAILTRPESQLVSSVVKWKQRYLVPREDGTVALGSTTEKKSGFNINTTVEGIRDILSTTSEAVPQIASAPIEKTWAGLRPVGRDSKPHIGQVPDIEGLFVATGHYKIGFGYLPFTADVISKQVNNIELDFDPSQIAPRRAEPARKRNRAANGQRSRA